MSERTEAQKFEAAARKLARDIGALAAGIEPERASALLSEANRLSDRARYVAPTAPNGVHVELLAAEILYGVGEGARRLVIAARERAQANLTAHREAQIAELKKAARAEPEDGFSKEIATRGVGYGPRYAAR